MRESLKYLPTAAQSDKNRWRKRIELEEVCLVTIMVKGGINTKSAVVSFLC